MLGLKFIKYSFVFFLLFYLSKMFMHGVGIGRLKNEKLSNWNWRMNLLMICYSGWVSCVVTIRKSWFNKNVHYVMYV